MSSFFSTLKVDLSRFDWQGVSAVSDLLMVLLNIVLIVSVVIGYRSLRESAKSRDATLLIWATERMDTIRPLLEQLRAAPAYGSLNDIRAGSDFSAPWSPELLGSANRVGIELQRLSYMANKGLISREHFIAMWGPTFVAAWEILEVPIKHRRLKNGEPMHLHEGAYSRRDFETFSMLCKAH